MLCTLPYSVRALRAPTVLPVVLLLAACATADDPPGVGGADASQATADASQATADASQATADGAPGAADATAMQFADAGPPPALHLLLSEVALAPEGGEFVEIYNPADVAISLAGYHLTDDATYYQLPSGPPSMSTTDFLVAFPPEASIAPKQVVIVAIDSATAFAGIYAAAAPDFAIGAPSGATLPMTLLAGGATPTLTNTGEGVVLFYWDGASDRVADADMLNVGVPSDANAIQAKTDLAIDGPDPDGEPSIYARDALTMGVQAVAPVAGESTKRIAHEVGFETQAGGGNGVTGDDETSEVIDTTWDRAPYSAPTPGVVFPTL